MPRIILALFAVVLITHSIFSQDCSSLTLNLVSKSDYNGYNISCHATMDGSIQVSASGGETPYTFTLGSQSNSSGIFPGLPRGNHTIAVRDNLGCEKSLLINLTEPPVLVGTIFVTSNYNGQQLSCHNASDGIIIAVATGGTSPYTYTLHGESTNSTGANTGIFTGLSAGLYYVTIIDVNGCDFATVPAIITSPTPVASTSAVTSVISCNGANDAVITATAIGGAASFVYTLDQMPENLTGKTTGIFTNVAPGMGYTVSVRDANGCTTVTNALDIVQPSAVVVFGGVISNYNGHDISCFGNSNGALAGIASGGAGNYVYQLKRDGSQVGQNFTGIFNGLNAGTYTVSSIDENSCASIAAPIVITQPSAISANTSLNNGTAENCSDASITVTASGGAGFYTYLLGQNTTGASTGTFTGLINGSYSIEVRDRNGCFTTTSPVQIDQPNNLAITLNTTNVSCFGDNDGQITALASGGSGYQFSLLQTPSNVTGVTSGVFTGLAAGDYAVKVQDANQCEKTSSTVLISSPAQITVNLAITSDYNDAHISCFGEDDGHITVQASGGTGMFLYKLNGTGVQINSGQVVFNSLTAGEYSATAEDANGCTITTSTVTLTQPEELTLQSTITNTGNNEGSIELTVDGGTSPYNFAWSNESTQQNLMNVASGEYTVEISDANECFLTESFIIPLFVGVSEENERLIQVLYDTYSGKPYLSCLLNSAADVSINLFDLKGSTNYSVRNRQEAGLQQYSLSAQLQPGLYIAHVRINEKTYAKKFIVF